MENNNIIWIVGCGDIGRRVAGLYQSKSLHGIVSSHESAKKTEALGIQTQALDLDATYTHSATQFMDSEIFYFVPPQSTGSEDTRLKRFLDQLSKQTPKRIVMISTTGVYGDSGGAWIDESTPLNPQADRAIRRVSAEHNLQKWADKTGCEFMILRVPGIYAKDRLPLIRLQKKLPIVNFGEAGYTNRIHADDLASACKAAMECEASNHIINVTDGNPSTMTEYFNHVADYAKLPRPPQISMAQAEQTLSEGMVSYLKESRRIKNEKMLALLDFELDYPSLSHALKV